MIERNGRKTLTTVQGLPKKFDQKKILKVIKKKFGGSWDKVLSIDFGFDAWLSSLQWDYCQWYWNGRGDPTPGWPTQRCPRVSGWQEGGPGTWCQNHQGTNRANHSDDQAYVLRRSTGSESSPPCPWWHPPSSGPLKVHSAALVSTLVASAGVTVKARSCVGALVDTLQMPRSGIKKCCPWKRRVGQGDAYHSLLWFESMMMNPNSRRDAVYTIRVILW